MQTSELDPTSVKLYILNMFVILLSLFIYDYLICG